MEGDGTEQKNGSNGAPHVPLTLEALGEMILATRTELGSKLGSIQTDQVEGGKTLEAIARSHRRTRKKIIKFINKMAEVYQRQQAISTRLTEIESWQALHSKDHRDSKPPPSRRKRPAKELRVARGG